MPAKNRNTDLIAPIIYKSKNSETMVTFPPEIFGYLETTSGQEFHPPVEFSDNHLRVTSKKLRDMLDEHTGNQINGGSDFWKLSDSERDQKEISGGNIVIRMADNELNETDHENLKFLSDLVGGIQDSEKPIAITKMEQLSDRFGVVGFDIPDKSLSRLRFQAEIVRFLGAFEDNSIWEIDE